MSEPQVLYSVESKGLGWPLTARIAFVLMGGLIVWAALGSAFPQLGLGWILVGIALDSLGLLALEANAKRQMSISTEGLTLGTRFIAYPTIKAIKVRTLPLLGTSAKVIIGERQAGSSESSVPLPVGMATPDVLGLLEKLSAELGITWRGPSQWSE